MHNISMTRILIEPIFTAVEGKSPTQQTFQYMFIDRSTLQSSRAVSHAEDNLTNVENK